MRNPLRSWILLHAFLLFVPPAVAQEIPSWRRQKFFGDREDPPDGFVLWEERADDIPWSLCRPYDRTGVEVLVITPEPFLMVAQGAYLRELWK